MNKNLAPRFLQLFFGLLILTIYLPLFFLFLSSIRNLSPNVGENVWTLKWYELLLQNSAIWNSCLHSFNIAFLNGCISTFLGFTAAYCLERSQHVIVRLLRFLVYSSLALPELVFALGLLALYALLHFQLGFISVLIAHVTLTLPFTIFLISGQLRKVDFHLEEAAMDLGASEWQIVWKILLPMLKTSLQSSFIISFLISFDDFLITYFVNGIGQDTLPVLIYTTIRNGTSPQLQALSVLLLLATTLIATMNRYFSNSANDHH